MSIKIVTIEDVSDNELQELQREFLKNKEIIHGSNGLTYEKNLKKWRAKINRLENKPAKNESLTKQFLVIDRNRNLVGIIDLRDSLTSYLELEGGHIGYSIKKSSRGLGYGGLALQEVLSYCQRKTTLSKVLLTCEEQNLISKKIILKNNGEFSKKITLNKRIIEHYWIEL